ncbi:MAG TPA: glycosyltransferase family 39 protein [Pirellulales bacterium]|nr:glycosyltransferase family 39 protein [Pirellulales bacterium]
MRTIESGRRAKLAFLAVVVLAIALRWEQIGRLSLAHFDEGVLVSGAFGVCLKGMWDFPLAQPLQSPPLFPWMLAGTFGLTGMTLPVMGIYLSAAFGVATVAIYFALLRRIYGDRLALAGAGLLAASDLHVAFSRMALTDVPLTFWFVLGAYCLVRLAECGGRTARMAGWSLAFGLAIGAAWNTKYNGWMLAAAAGTTWLMVAAREPILRWLGHRHGESPVPFFGERRIALAIALSAVVAIVCFIPWYRYVELNYEGGYRAVVSNHLRYAGGLAQWPARALRLTISLSAFRHYGWMVTLLAATVATGSLLRRRMKRAGSATGSNPFVVVAAAIVGLAAAVALGGDAVLFFLATAAILPALLWGRWEEVFFAVWAGAFLIMTPFYHPYTRLLVPALPAAIGLVLGLMTRGLGLVEHAEPHSAAGAEHGGACRAERLSRRFLAVGCALALLTALIWHPLGWLPSRHLWQRWSTTQSYRALGDAIDKDALPTDAMVLCLGVPAMTLYIEREWSPIEVVPFEKVLAGVAHDRDSYLAVDFWGAYGENHQLALESLEQRLECLEPIAAVSNDLNLATLLDYLEPADLARHLSGEWPALRVRDAGGREVVFPARLGEPNAEVIVLYRIDRNCLAAKHLD